jgi:general secretion pathway protein K
VKTDRVISNQSGLALVLTLLIISFLVAVTVQLMITIDRQVSVSTAQREQVRLDNMVWAGLSLARAALFADQKENNFDSLQDSWASLNGDAVKALSKDVDLVLTVTDLSGRLQINALGDAAKQQYREIWRRFFLSGRFAIASEEEAESLLDALGDWIDQDDNEREQGAEEQYYLSLNPSYPCRNGQMTYPEEILLVKGMTSQIVYGDQDHEGIIDYITVIGDDGKINLNTAPLPVLMAFSADMTEKVANNLMEFREDKRHGEALATTDWYQQVRGIPDDVNADVLTVKSTYFRVSASASINQYTRTGRGILHRAENQEQTIQLWKTE